MNVTFTNLTPVQVKIMERMIILYSIQDEKDRAVMAGRLKKYGDEMFNHKVAQNTERVIDIRVIVDQFQAQFTPTMLCSIIA